jgi:PhnB protein
MASSKGEGMNIEPYLSFNGNCKEAFQFYEKALGGKIAGIFTYGESPMAAQTPPEMKNWVMHVRLDVAGQAIMGADAPPQMFSKPQGFSVSIGVKSVEEAERLFAALSPGADIKMPIQQTFWSPRFGMLIDRFGIPWMINAEAHQTQGA